MIDLFLNIVTPCITILVYILTSSIKRQQEYIMKTYKYIDRLKAVAKMQGVDLSDVHDDRRD